MDDWWGDLDGCVLRCLADNGAMAPGDLGRTLGLSEDAVISLICLLAQERKVMIRLVERHPAVDAGGEFRAA